MAPPKAILFDIGGVCVASPFQAIVDYEKKNNIPKDWINFAISRSAPNGSWQRLERGEIKLDDDFFKGFKADLENPRLWEEFHRTGFKAGKKRLKDIANPTQLGDPVSLKAETADSTPTNHDRGAQSPRSTEQSRIPSGQDSKQPPKKLKDLAMENPTMLGDPVSLKAETADSSPTEQDKGAQSSSSSSSNPSKAPSSNEQPKKLKDLAKENPTLLGDPVSLKAEAADSSPTNHDRGAQQSPPSSTSTAHKSLKDLAKQNPTMLGDPVSLKAETADSSPTENDRGAASSPIPANSKSIPPTPSIDASALFWAMMTISRAPDPHIFPALQSLSASKKFILGALSNTITFPPGHPYSEANFSPSTSNSSSEGSAGLPASDRKILQSFFDVFISSSEVGIRKPDRKIYELAIKELDAFDKGRGGSGVRPGEVLFLDDIGENCRMGREVGMRTLRVRLGETEEAVRELEKEVEMDLRGRERSEVKAKL